MNSPNEVSLSNETRWEKVQSFLAGRGNAVNWIIAGTAAALFAGVFYKIGTTPNANRPYDSLPAVKRPTENIPKQTLTDALESIPTRITVNGADLPSEEVLP